MRSLREARDGARREAAALGAPHTVNEVSVVIAAPVLSRCLECGAWVRPDLYVPKRHGVAWAQRGAEWVRVNCIGVVID